MGKDFERESDTSLPLHREETISRRILTIRGHRIMLDADLAELYGVPTKVFNQAVHRNAERFPEDFTFQLSREEAESLRSQIVTLKTGPGSKSGG